MQNTILYIHGFNSGPGQKVTQLKAAGFKVICPQLTNNVFQDLETLAQLIDNNTIKYVLGTSLGGYYAMVLSCVYQVPYYYVINPSYKPFNTLQRFLNQPLTNYKTSATFTVTQKFLNDLKFIFPKLEGVPMQSFNFYFGTKDKVLNCEELTTDLKALNKPLYFYFEKQDHRFQDLSLPIKHIKAQMDWENNPN